MSRGLRVLCITWNAKGAQPTDEDIHKMLLTNRNDDNTSPDIIAFTVQETLEMKVWPIMKAKIDNRKPKMWKRILQSAVSSPPLQHHDYKLVECEALLGMFIIVFAKNEIMENLHKTNVGTSVANTIVGNKGGVAVRFDYWDPILEDFKSFCFVGVHLTSREGTDNIKNSDLEVITKLIKWKKKTSLNSRPSMFYRALRRRGTEKSSYKENDIILAQINTSKVKEKVSVTRPNGRRRTMYQTTTGAAKNTSLSGLSTRMSESDEVVEIPEENISMLDHDAVIVFGDLNYRLENVKVEEVIEAIKDGGHQLQDLQENYDHLAKNMAEQKALVDFREGPKSFPPTYKYVVGSNDYVMKRTPSWTDRVLYKTSNKFENVVVLCYDSIQEVTVSDHKPVIKDLLLS